MREIFYNGEEGNLSLHVVTVTLAALAAAGTKVIASRLPIGTEITGVRYVSANLGAGTGIKVDLVDSVATRPVLTTTTTTAAKNGFVPLKPIYVGDDGVADLVLTNTGTSPATGEVVIQLEYRFKGY